MQFNPSESTLKKNLDELFTKAKEVPNKYILGTPQVDAKSDEGKKSAPKHGQNSKRIDFILLKYDDKKGNFQIITVDVTINSKGINDKIINAMVMLKGLLDEEISQNPAAEHLYSLKHIILCPQKDCEK